MYKIIISLLLINIFVVSCTQKEESHIIQPKQISEKPSSLKELIGETLINAKNESVPADQLSGKKVGFYFSAHWCPPCRIFTPKLVKFYNELKNQNKGFEIIFISSDQDENAMFNYMKKMKMPWLAFPFGDMRSAKLAKKYGIRAIPTLVILNNEGKLITKDGRMDIEKQGLAAYDRW